MPSSSKSSRAKPLAAPSEPIERLGAHGDADGPPVLRVNGRDVDGDLQFTFRASHLAGLLLSMYGEGRNAPMSGNLSDLSEAQELIRLAAPLEGLRATSDAAEVTCKKADRGLTKANRAIEAHKLIKADLDRSRPSTDREREEHSRLVDDWKDEDARLARAFLVAETARDGAWNVYDDAYAAWERACRHAEAARNALRDVAELRAKVAGAVSRGAHRA